MRRLLPLAKIYMQGRIAQADTQEHTLKPESLQPGDTCSKKVDTKEDQTIKPDRVQTTGEIGERITSDENDKQVGQDQTDQESHGEDNAAEDQALAIQDDQHPKYHRMITTILQ